MAGSRRREKTEREGRGDAACPKLTVSTRISALARRQHGIVARRQLLALGIERSLIHKRVVAGYLISIYPGVYAVGHDSLSQMSSWTAAVFAGGEDAVLSRRSAAALWRIGAVPSKIEVTRRFGPDQPVAPLVARGTTRLVIHRSRVLGPADVTRHRGLPVTSVARTLLDLAAVVSRRQLEEALTAAERQRIVVRQDLIRMARRGRGWKGVGKLREVVDAWDPRVLETRSELEVDFLRFCDKRGIPEPAVNSLVAGLEVDFCWPEARLIVELDGFEHHRGRLAFERDHNRMMHLRQAGFDVFPVTYRMLHDAPEAVARSLRAALS